MFSTPFLLQVIKSYTHFTLRFTWQYQFVSIEYLQHVVELGTIRGIGSPMIPSQEHTILEQVDNGQIKSKVAWGRTAYVFVGLCLSLLPIDMINTMNKNDLERNGFFFLAYKLKPVIWKARVVTQGKILEERAELQTMGEGSFTGSLLLACSSTSLVHLRPTHLGIALLTKAWVLPQHQQLRKCLTDRSIWQKGCLNQGPPSRVTLVCIKLTND